MYIDKPPLSEVIAMISLDSENAIEHYGTKRHSGRYPWGSGDSPYQHGGDFLSRYDELKKQGLTEKEISNAIMGPEDEFTVGDLRLYKAIANEQRRYELVKRAERLREKGMSLNDIAKEMGYNNDSSVRSLLDEKSKQRMTQCARTAESLKQVIAEKQKEGYVGVDVGAGIERELNMSRVKLDQTLLMLQMEGYHVYGAGVGQVNNPGKQTNIKTLCAPGTEYSKIYDFDKIASIKDYVSTDGGETIHKQQFHYPASIDSSRVMVRGREDGGANRDGLIEIRRGVDDLSLGNSKYAQVRILTDGTHYLKGMAVYADDLPDGVDIRFNSNKSKDLPKMKHFKEIHTEDPNNPFGSLIKENGQSFYTDKDGKQKLSAINKRAEEGDWDEWDNTLSSQFLAKQSKSLINRQLGLATYDKEAEFKEIMALENPTVKKNLLKSFADDCDASAIHLKAASLPRQSYKVILPIPSLKDNEVYAPTFKDGEQIALIRYPHGGTFEIPILTVNNKHRASKGVMGNALDAIGINSKVAERLSGADFDGDTVMCIPTHGSNGIKITSTNPLKGLEGFDTKLFYGTTQREDGVYVNAAGKPVKIMSEGMKQKEMGVASNLITDMTIKGAEPDELARAVRHSMVVIDAPKHKLDYKRSYIENDIESLKKKYQINVNEDGSIKYGGSSTLMSRAKSRQDVTKRRGTPKIDPNTGELVYQEVEEYYTIKQGKTVKRMEQSSKMAETKDARTLMSGPNHEGTPKELAYANYANKMKSLANEARKELLRAGKIEYSATAKAQYKKEVDRLEAALAVAESNAPKERKAQMIAKSKQDAAKKANPDITNKELKKIGQMALTDARNSLGAHKETIKISDKEWEAIQAGAISESKLTKILNNADMDVVRQKAMPRTMATISPAKQAKIKAMQANGNYSIYDIAKACGVSTSTVSNYISKGSV